jgi:AbrB family looped-hinge helix DNA binding protein
MPIAKFTKKGQITIPIEYRKLLGSEIVEITYEDGKVVIKPVKKLGGALKDYAIKDKPIEEVIKLEKEAMVNGFTEREKAGNN